LFTSEKENRITAVVRKTRKWKKPVSQKNTVHRGGKSTTDQKVGENKREGGESRSSITRREKRAEGWGHIERHRRGRSRRENKKKKVTARGTQTRRKREKIKRYRPAKKKKSRTGKGRKGQRETSEPAEPERVDRRSKTRVHNEKTGRSFSAKQEQSK